ncbi:MAG: 2-C-methyl-D-erythritol 4-phosphate cytidylyltransferase [Endomicrobium sp.]|jgi:2-C-methyl-D-erythritol 4-phosphate cytidylyltransferase|nr:2-C-methyl-D-erythritol 4-phosphate cytidylyltransferase [Endomicrobium sp.]
MKNAAIIVAAGLGKRFWNITSGKNERKVPKQFLDLNGKPVFLWSAETFASIKSFRQIIVAVPSDMLEALSLKYGMGLIFASGGGERFDSVKNALAVVEEDIDFIAVHDAARPLITREDILAVLRSAEKTKAAIAVEKAKDTVKVVTADDRYILKTLDRAVLRNAQTPQIFENGILKRAYREKMSVNATDDSQLVENLKIRVSAVETKFPNFKITTKQDLELAAAVMTFRSNISG